MERDRNMGNTGGLGDEGGGRIGRAHIPSRALKALR